MERFFDSDYGMKQMGSDLFVETLVLPGCMLKRQSLTGVRKTMHKNIDRSEDIIFPRQILNKVQNWTLFNEIGTLFDAVEERNKCHNFILEIQN